MSFNSLTFVVFFAAVLMLYRLFSHWAWRKTLLLVSSYLFYAAWNPPFVLLLLFTTVVDWWLARLIYISKSITYRRVLLGLSLLSNLGLLAFFKYGEFLLENFKHIVATLGWNYTAPAWDIVLPMGISFYTFQSMSYTIDVYRRQLRAEVSFADFALFVSFFPQLVAGPIVRALTFLPQLYQKIQVSKDQIGWGLVLVIFGLFQKVVLADTVFAPVVDSLYGDPFKASALNAWAGIFAFSGQIFCDFAGYSTCAIGLALCFGFELPDNFRSPYGAIGFSDFWRRWHISLSTWLRDYLYISLGGNRQGEIRTIVNLLITMLIGGLWHGASWMFVLWGGLHGLYLLLEHRLRGHFSAPKNSFVSYLASFATFLIITLTWIPFRAEDGATLLGVARALLRFDQALPMDMFGCVIALVGVTTLLRWHWTMRNQSLEAWFAKQYSTVQTALVGGCLVGIYLVSGGNQRAFIYFQF